MGGTHISWFNPRFRSFADKIENPRSMHQDRGMQGQGGISPHFSGVRLFLGGCCPKMPSCRVGRHRMHPSPHFFQLVAIKN